MRAGDTAGKWIIAVAMFLSAFGVLAVLSSSMVTGGDRNFGYDSLHFFLRQFMAFVVGIVGMILVRRNMDLLRKHSLLILVCIMMASLGVALFTKGAQGAQRWVNLFGLSIQVSEFAKLAIILYVADFFARSREKIQNLNHLHRRRQEKWAAYNIRCIFASLEKLWPPLLFVVLTCAVIEAGHDLGSCIVIGVVFLVMLFTAGVRKELIMVVIGLGVALGACLLIKEPYRFLRIMSFVVSNKDDPSMKDLSYQGDNAKLAIGSGGMLGSGMPFSAQKFDFLPEQYCDFIYAVISEELGFFGAVSILGLYFSLCYLGCKLAMVSKDTFRKLLACGITVQLVFQVLFNVGVVVGALPNKGLALPFISYGGSSMVASLMGVGALLYVFDNKSLYGEPVKDAKKNQKRQRRSGSTLASSESPVVAISSGEWESIQDSSAEHKALSANSLPRPVVEPYLATIVPIQVSDRAKRERQRDLERERRGEGRD